MVFKRKNEIEFDSQLIEAFSKKFKLNTNIIKLLFQRNINTEAKIEKFLNPSINDFNNPFDLKNMQEVIDRVNYHISNNSSIVILGDYDTDGICASAIIYKYLIKLTPNVNVFLPNRISDGYGLSKDTIDKIKSLYNPDFIITVDCGISAVNEVDYCKSLGIEIVITDHHDIPDVIPNCLIINPKLDNQLYKFKELCGAGVALKVVQAIIGFEQSLKEYITIAAIATVADIVPLIDENRSIVYLGLKEQENNLPIGIKKLLKKLKCELPLTSTDISFKVAPKLNATGRMGDASISFKLFIEEDDYEIDKIITNLIELNEKRLVETNKIIDDVSLKLDRVNISKVGAIVLYNDEWESGVLGIICSKLVEKYNRPVCILTKVDNEYKGSLRSVPGVNIFEALNNIKEHLIQFGGHNQAAGVTVEPNKLEDFKYALNRYVLNNYDKTHFIPCKYYDLDISNIQLENEFITQLDVLEPFGLQNEKPQFLMSCNSIRVSRMVNHPNHICFKLKNINFIGFNLGDYVDQMNTNSNKDIIVELQKEKYKNRILLKGLVKFVRCGKIKVAPKNEYNKGNFLTQLQMNKVNANFKNIAYLSEKDAISTINKCLNDDIFGTILITYDFSNYIKYCNLFKQITNYEYLSIKDSSAVNTIIFAPEADMNLKSYKNIFLLEKPVCDGFVKFITDKKSRAYIINSNDMFIDIKTDRGVFTTYHNAIKKCISNTTNFINMYEFYNLCKDKNPQIVDFNFEQFRFVLLVFEELKIVNITSDMIDFTGVKSDLNKSKILQCFNNLNN